MIHYQPKHIYSVYIFFSGKSGPFKYPGGISFQYKPIHVCCHTSLANAKEEAIGLRLAIMPNITPYFEGLNERQAEVAVDRLKSILGIEATGGPLKDLSKTSKKKKRLTEEHKAKISRAMTGKSPSKATREKLRAAHLGKRKPWVRASNQARSLHWQIIDPYSREYNINNLSQFCRDRGIPQGGLWAVSAELRRHYKFWSCQKKLR